MIHDTTRGPAIGGCRLSSYASTDDALLDAVRLAVAMTRKCALAGLNAGGGKGVLIDHAGITVNKNAIPFDTEPIMKTGGIRIGTPAMTTRGMKEEEMMEIADLIHAALQKADDPAALASLQKSVHSFTSRYPLP